MINDPNALDQYIDLMGEDGKEFVVEIIDTFLSDVINNFRHLDESLATNDYPTFRRAAHTLKTGCAIVGATALSQGFLILEEAGAAENLTSVGGFLEKYKLDFQKLKDELEQNKTAMQA
jgi:HPt (histidine-containing phosphotransfer) domain-containing protein